jgi:putative PIN family toxin of toxin-antitoxin system
LNSEGNPRKVIDLWRFEKITLCLSKEIVAEYFAVLERFGMSEEPEGEELVQLFQKRYNQVFLTPIPAISAISEDPADDKFIACAIAAEAKYVISGDRHLLNLKGFEGIRILSPTEFLKVKL